VRVVALPVQFCEGDRCTPWSLGVRPVPEPSGIGSWPVIPKIIDWFRDRVGGGNVRTSRPYVVRSDREHDAPLPPVLLFSPADTSRVLSPELSLLWLPAQTGVRPIPTHVQVFRGASEACTGGDIVLDTTVVGGHLEPAALGLTRGDRFRVVVESGAGRDEACATVALEEEIETVEAEFIGTYQMLARGLTPSDWAAIDPTFEYAAVLDLAGFTYDALLLVDSAMTERDGASDLRQAWAGLVRRTTVAATP